MNKSLFKVTKVYEAPKTNSNTKSHTLTADIRGLTSQKAVMEALATVWLLPSHFGKNLDALVDVLAEQPPPKSLVIVAEQTHTALDTYLAKLQDACQEITEIWAEQKITTTIEWFHIAKKGQ